MQNNQLEIEIKSLLWSKEKRDELMEKLSQHYPNHKLLNKEKQLNHYFKDWNFPLLYSNIEWLLNDEQKVKFKNIVEHWKKHSVRTRWIDITNESILVVKAAVDETTWHTWVSRLEFEAKFNNLSLEQLDNILLNSWFDYLSKWSREREEYEIDNITLCLDKNAWYWYLAEFEMVVNANEDFNQIQSYIRTVMAKLWVEELDQWRHDRMFAYYNENWPTYYGTENIFTVL